ncbi:MAG TPA: hypothetical protein VFE24_13070, partial [Pirellulales bacterium]|nr:hypothetical protein [Pirellulales bacterium]
MYSTVLRFALALMLAGGAAGFCQAVAAAEPEVVPTPSGDLANRLDGTFQSLVPDDSITQQYQQECPAPVCSTADNYRPGSWFIDAGFEVLHRTKYVGQHSAIFGEDTTLANFNGVVPTVTFANREFPLAPGARFTIGHYLDSSCSEWDRNFEFTFLGLFEFDNHTTLTSLGAEQIFVPGFSFLGGFNAADTFATNFHTSFNSFEWNIRFTEDLPRDR